MGWLGLRSAAPDTVRGVLPLDPATPYVRFVPDSSPTTTAVLVHGLNSNKEFMQTFAMALADAGVDTYAIDLPGHGDSSEPFNYANSLRAVTSLLDTFERQPVVVGHSMGGGLLADLAPLREFETMLLLSPVPVPVEDFPARRLLIVSGALEAPRINAFFPTLIESASGETLWLKFPDAGHSTALFAPGKIRQAVEWVVGDEVSSRTTERYVWLLLMALAGFTGGWMLLPRSEEMSPLSPRSPVLTRTLVGYIAASGGAIVLLGFVNPMGWLNLFATDYLFGFILVTGLLLWRGSGFPITGKGVTVGVLAAVYAITVLLAGVGENLIHLVPSGIQWLWFPVLTLAGLPLFVYDELALRSIPVVWKRWGMFLLTRIILWASVVTGVLLLNPDKEFLVLIMHLIVVFWIVLWGGTGLIARRTGEAGAAALFAAIVHGWALASIFVRV